MLPENPAQVIRVLTLFWSGLLADGKKFSCRGSVLATALGVCSCWVLSWCRRSLSSVQFRKVPYTSYTGGALDFSGLAFYSTGSNLRGPDTWISWRWRSTCHPQTFVPSSQGTHVPYPFFSDVSVCSRYTWRQDLGSKCLVQSAESGEGQTVR
jgi:hypothetical protein